jgi:hypothetical protein
MANVVAPPIEAPADETATHPPLAKSSRIDDHRPPPRHQAKDVLATMLRSVSQTIFGLLSDRECSIYTPDASMLARMVQIMDEKMLTNRYRKSHFQRWCPISTRIYITTLWYIQILRCMRSLHVLDASTSAFLFDFELNVPLNTLPIPGPLAPFFSALSVCESADKGLGPIGPSIPIPPPMAANRGSQIDQLYLPFLPNLWHLFRGYANLSRMIAAPAPVGVGAAAPQPQIHINWDFNLNNPASQNLHVIGGNNPAHAGAYTRISPFGLHRSGMTENHRTAFVTSTIRPTMPEIDANANANPPETWKDYLFPNNVSYEWIHLLSAIFVEYSQYWEGISI